MNEFMLALDTSQNKEIIQLKFVLHYLTAFNVYDHLIDPELITRWLAPKVEKIHCTAGGEYHFIWSNPENHLRGKYLKAIGGEILDFTWQWDNEKDIPPRTVKIEVIPSRNGQFSTVLLLHGTFGMSDDEQSKRTFQLVQWINSFIRLTNYWQKGH